MAELPTGWVEARLRDIVEVNPRRNVSGLEMEAVSFVPMAALDEKQGEIVAAEIRGYSDVSRGYTQFQESDVIFAKITPSMQNGKSAVARNLANGIGFGSTEFHVLRPVGSVLPEYLWRFVRQRSFRDAAQKTMKGAVGQQRVPADFLADHLFWLPPLAEQKRIVAKVNMLLARITRAREALAHMPVLVETAKAALLSTAVSGEVTADWRRRQKLPEPTDVVLGNHVIGASYGTSAKSSPSGSVPVLRMGNIQDGNLNWTDLVFTSDSTEIKKYTLSEGDVLFNRTNSPELVGKSAYFDGSRVAIFAGYLIRVRCDETLNPKFLTFCLNSPQGREYSRKVRTDGVSQSNINAKKLQTYPLRLPSLREQAEIVGRLESALSTLVRISENHRNAIVELDTLEQQILAKAFRGELVPQDPNDEPAISLISRVKAEREVVKPTAQDKLPKARNATADTHTPRKPRIDAMSKTRTDDNVWHKPYLKNLLALEELIDDIDLSSELGIEPSGPREPEEVAQALFKKSELEIADFYKQLTWEIEAGHIVDDDGKLRVA